MVVCGVVVRALTTFCGVIVELLMALWGAILAEVIDVFGAIDTDVAFATGGAIDTLVAVLRVPTVAEVISAVGGATVTVETDEL